MLKVAFRARGHRNVTATHRSTFEVTAEPEIGLSADCIVAVGADMSPASIPSPAREHICRDDARMTVTISCGGFMDTVGGWGSKSLTLSDSTSMVFRVSDFICGRTVMVNADKPASMLDRKLVAALGKGLDAQVLITVERGEKEKPSLDILF